MSSETEFVERYTKVLRELDLLYSGSYDKDDADKMAALTLLARSNLASLLANAEMRAKSIKREIDFMKADLYCDLKEKSEVKLTDVGLSKMVDKDEKINDKYKELFEAERTAKKFSGLFGVLSDAHISFRLYSRKD